jgi:hypothetical protein
MDEFAPSVGGGGPPSTCSNAAAVPDRRHPLRQSSAALGTEDERARLLAIASAILLFCTRSLGTGRPRRDRAGGRAALQVDGEELTTGRRSLCGPGPASTGRRRPAPHPRGRPDCPRPDRAGPHHPHPRAGVGGDGGPEPNRPPAAGTWHPSTPGRAVASRGTWAVQPRQPVLRVGVAPPGRSQVRQYRPPGSGRGAPASRPRKARPAPAVTERTWSEMSTGRGGGRPRS